MEVVTGGGSIAFFATYRPPVPLDIYSSPIPPTSPNDELPMTDGHSYNYNGRPIPKPALEHILNQVRRYKPQSLKPDQLQQLTDLKNADIKSGRVSGLVLVSERTQNLETLHFAILQDGKCISVVNFGELYGISCESIRMEDSGCIAGDNLIYVTTKKPSPERRQPWTAVYKTNLKNRKTERLTPPDTADISPSVSPSGKMIAVATYQFKAGGWKGEIEDLKTDIFVMDVDNPIMQKRRRVVSNGGWPSWGDDNTLFFHRRDDETKWGVYRADISKCHNSRRPTSDIISVTPDTVDAMTPAAIDPTTVVVAIIHRRDKKFSLTREESQYRHIEIFHCDGINNSTKEGYPIQITQMISPKADHYNPFVITDHNGHKRVSYHRCRNQEKAGEIQKQSNRLVCPHSEVGLFRVPGVFPTFSSDGTKLAFVDNEFRRIWLADSKGLRPIYQAEGRDCMFSPVWNQNPDLGILYVCMGPSFSALEEVNIYEIKISDDTTNPMEAERLTEYGNNAFPSTNPDGTRLVFRSTRNQEKGKKFKNLYIMEDAECGDFCGALVTRLTEGEWVDTHCQWSPNGEWIVFSSTRDKPGSQEENDHGGLDPGYYGVYLVKADGNSQTPVIRVVHSGSDLSGHVTHPFFSPNGRHIVLTSDLAGVSADPISLPLFLHSVRPYGDIFSIELRDLDDINKNEDIKEFTRITHSRYENGIAAWTKFSTQDPAAWNLFLDEPYKPICPLYAEQGAENWNMTGHLCISKRCC